MRPAMLLTDDYDRWIKFSQQYSEAIDRWIYAPDRWHNCPSHRLNKETPTRYRATFLASYHNNKPDDWSELRWYNYLLKLWEKKF
jgi:hypothetical protein